MKLPDDYRECVASITAKPGDLEERFSDVRGNAIMEELLCAVREYFAEKEEAHEKG